MALHKLAHIKAPCLHEPAQTVNNIDAEIQQLLDDMFETMYDSLGIGLAAPQIGIAKRIAVIDVTPDKSQQLSLINPEITEREGNDMMEEGCLSVPGHRDTVPRATHVTLRALDRNGKPYEIEADGLLAHCIQHEVDHLDGKLYIDYLSRFKQQRIRKKVEKLLLKAEE